jgi:hypothetical protein
MGADRNRKRLEKIESSLRPRELVASWIEDFAKFSSFEDYVSWVYQDRLSRAPLDKMFQQIETGITGRRDGRENSSVKNSRELLRKKSEVLFLANLVVNINLQAYYFLAQEEFLRAIIDDVQAVNDSLLSGAVLFGLRNGLAEDFLPSKDPKCRRVREQRASQIGMLISKEVSKLELGLQAFRVRICRLLTEVRALLTGTERLTARHFPGLKILFKSDANALNLGNARAPRLVDEYNKLADFIEARQNRIFGRKLVGRIEKIEENATDQAAEERVAAIIAFAKAEM